MVSMSDNLFAAHAPRKAHRIKPPVGRAHRTNFSAGCIVLEVGDQQGRKCLRDRR
jgi:hypothetical protein